MAANPSAGRDAPSLGGLNPGLPELRKNPYPIYHMLRTASPILQPEAGMWVLTRYDDGDAVLLDKRFATVDLSRLGRAGNLPPTEVLKSAREVMGLTMLFMDPPGHGRIRGLVGKAFSPRMVDSLRPRIEQIAAELLSHFNSSREIDLIGEFAYPLPVIVIAEMLGVPAQDRELFRRWASNLAPLIDFVQDMAVVQRAMDSMAEVRDYLSKIVEERRRNPTDDLISALTQAEVQGDRLTTQEMLANIVLLLVAGHETTANLIGNGMRALLENRGELERLQKDPGLIGGTVEEALRYDSPIQATGRRANEDADIAGTKIHKGDHAVVLIGACNRDPARFPDPDRFDITRANNEHLAFGGGIHYCLGSNLARLEARTAIGALVRTYPKIELAGGPLEIRDMFNVRGLKALPVLV